MAVFDELNRGSHRFEDPEARKAEPLQRQGDGGNLKRKSSGVTFGTYKSSLLVGYVLIGVIIVGAIGFFGFIAVRSFIGG